MTDIKKSQQKVALISGGTRGIGLAIAKRLAARGYAIATFSRTANEVDSFAGKMAPFNVPTLTFCGDASDNDFLARVTTEVLNKLGGITLLINNAGLGKKATILDAKIEDWEQTLDVNLNAAMHLTKLCLPSLIESRSGAVINIVSIAGKIGLAGSSAYCAAKFGLLGFTEALFEEVREDGVKVSAICPGYVDTKLVPSRKALIREEMIHPDDIAIAVEFVLDTSLTACPTEIVIRPQRSPFRK